MLRTELRRPSWKRDHVALGTNTDPYQWVEGRYRLTRGVWEAMRDFSNPCSVLTKSPLLLRDLDLFRELVERTEFSASLSIPTLEETAWRATEPHTPHPRKRIEAVAELVRSGIPTGVLVAPLIPGVNDDPEQVEELLGLLGEAGAESVERHRPASARRGQGDLVRLAAPVSARPRASLREAVPTRRLPARGRGPSGSRTSRAGPRGRAGLRRMNGGGRARARYGGAAAGTPAQALLSESATVTVPSAHAAASTNAAE